MGGVEILDPREAEYVGRGAFDGDGLEEQADVIAEVDAVEHPADEPGRAGVENGQSNVNVALTRTFATCVHWSARAPGRNR